ncbi:MAG: phage tail protein, partial [Treponema sp.]|nr:phage tail protein [Treponema sp.]
YQQLSLIDNDRMTATEVLQRTEENMRILGPNYDRLERDLLNPLVKRAYGILFRAGMILPPPEGIAGDPFVYESPMARAQRLNDLTSINQGIAVLAPLIQMKPDITDTIDLDEIAREAWKLSGVSPSAIRDAKEVQAIRQERNAAMMAAQEAQMAQALAKAGKDASQADPGAGLLGALTGAMGG